MDESRLRIQPEGVCLYEYTGYDGRATMPLSNIHTFDDLVQHGLNFKASSVSIPEGYTVRLFTGKSFDGDHWVLSQEDLNSSDFTHLGANNKINSIEVNRGIAFYSEVDCGGKMLNLYGEGKHVCEVNALSVSIPKDWSVQLFEKENFTGNTWELGQMDKNSANLNSIGIQKISSLVVKGIGVRFYELPNCKGNSTIPIPEGAYEWSDNLEKQFDFHLNWASSISIPNGYTVKISQDICIDGANHWILTHEDTENCNNFANFKADKMINAFEVHKGVTFYAAEEYGLSYTNIGIKEGFHTLEELKNLHFSDDSASSVSIPKGWAVRMYEDNNFNGQMWELGQMDENSAHLNKILADEKISSIQVIGNDPRIQNFRLMRIYYKNSKEDTDMLIIQGFYFNNKLLAFEFADSITADNKQTQAEYIIGAVLGKIKYVPLLGDLFGFMTTMDSSTRNNLANKIKRYARDSDGRVCVLLYRPKLNKTIVKRWDGKTIYGRETIIDIPYHKKNNFFIYKVELVT